MKTLGFASRALVPALAIALSTSAAHAAKFTVLHSFAGGSNDGAGPLGGVAPAGNGGFYVATDGGGSSNLGTLTLLRKDGTTQVLHAFTGGSDGQNADGTPIKWSYDGNVYGPTQFGGGGGAGPGCGTVYRYTPGSDAYQQLHAFQCMPDGAFPFAGLTDTGRGVLAGTTIGGGSNDGGATFVVRSDGTVVQGCSFAGEAYPFAGITEAPPSYEFTATQEGGPSHFGTITRFHDSCFGTIIHNFAGGSDGSNPMGTLLYYNNALYGTTSSGGATGLGTVFRINPDGSGYTVLHTFQGICCGNSDGSFPHSGLTLNKADGQLYGTTINGGNSSDSGTVFSIDPNTGAESVVHAFSGSDGAHPFGDLYINKKGKVYGTTDAGGGSNLGVVFRLGT